MDIIIADLSGHTFTIKLDWHIGAMTHSISFLDKKLNGFYLNII